MAQADSSTFSTIFLLFKLALFTALVPGTVTVWAPLYWIFPGVRHAPSGDFRVRAIAFVVLAVGIAGYLWCALDFAFRGKGTPAPIDPPKILVAKGLYKYTRNPMYISVLTVLAGECVLFWSLQLAEYAAAVAVGFHLFVLIYEEPALTRKMGAAYEQYRREVPRWIPRIAPRPSNDAL